MFRASRGFSLIELLMSLSVLAILATISFGAWSGVDVAETRRQAEAELSKMETQLSAYYLERGCYPTSLVEPSLPREDPWGNAYHYQQTSRRGYILLSAGPDGLIAKPFDKDNVIRKK